MRKLTPVFVGALLVASFVLAACGGGGGGAVGPGDPARGKALYDKKTLGAKSAEGCVSCHNYDAKECKDDKAPYTQGTGTRAATCVAGLSAEEYIRESIFKPDNYVVENYKAGDMYQGWEKELSKQQIEDLIAYLLTEK